MIFLIVVFALTLYSVFKGEDLHAVMRAIIRVNPWYLLPGIAGVVIFIWGESIIIYYMFGTRLRSARRNGRASSIPAWDFSSVPSLRLQAEGSRCRYIT